MSESAPEFAEPCIGWRTWIVVPDGDRHTIRSVLYPTVWEPRTALVACCTPGRLPVDVHDTPGPCCRCGIYAARSIDDALSYFDAHAPGVDDSLHRVIGLVSLWGSVVEGERGWRASHAYPHRLFVPASSADGLTAAPAAAIALDLTAYGVPVELVDAVTKRGIARLLDAALAPR